MLSPPMILTTEITAFSAPLGRVLYGRRAPSIRRRTWTSFCLGSMWMSEASWRKASRITCFTNFWAALSSSSRGLGTSSSACFLANSLAISESSALP